MRNYGYEIEKKTGDEIIYIKENYYNNKFITFKLILQEVLIEEEYGSVYEATPFTMQELKAINAKVKELGWEE